MLDFTRVTEAISSLIGGAVSSTGQGPSGPVLEMLQNAGLDPEALIGLSEGEITQLLAEHGLDPALLLNGQLDELLSQLGGADGWMSAFSGPVTEDSET